jgi:hypothetical protein
LRRASFIAFPVHFPPAAMTSIGYGRYLIALISADIDVCRVAVVTDESDLMDVSPLLSDFGANLIQPCSKMEVEYHSLS